MKWNTVGLNFGSRFLRCAEYLSHYCELFFQTEILLTATSHISWCTVTILANCLIFFIVTLKNRINYLRLVKNLNVKTAMNNWIEVFGTRRYFLSTWVNQEGDEQCLNLHQISRAPRLNTGSIIRLCRFTILARWGSCWYNWSKRRRNDLFSHRRHENK